LKVEIIAFDADPAHGGYGSRVHSLVRMFAQFAEVRVVLTDWFRAPEIPGVRYESLPLRDDTLSRFRRLRTYFRADFPPREAPDRPDLVLVESLDVLGLHQHGDAIPFILDEHNVYWELLSYEMVNAPFFKTWLGRKEWIRRRLVPGLLRRAKAFELAALRRATRVFVTSERDRALLLTELPELEGKTAVLPNCLDVEGFQYPANTKEGNRVVFVGSYNYVPNREAAGFISTVLAPAIPEAQFILIGDNPPRDVIRGPNISAPGFIPDLNETLGSAAVCIAPLTHGSGTRLKILEYLATGKAVVATTKACEGLEVEDGVHVLIRDDPEGFAAAVRNLLRDPSLRRGLGANGRRLVETRYDWRAYVGWLRDFTQKLMDGSPLGGAT